MELYHCQECLTMNGEFVNLNLCSECAADMDDYCDWYLTAQKEGHFLEEEPDLSQLEEVLN